MEEFIRVSFFSIRVDIEVKTEFWLFLSFIENTGVALLFLASDNDRHTQFFDV